MPSDKSQVLKNRHKKELSQEEKTKRQQEHNSAVEHGGVTQIGNFDPQQQQEERDKVEEENADKGYLNEFDPAYPTVNEDDLGETEDDDRDAKETAKKQGEVPGE